MTRAAKVYADAFAALCRNNMAEYSAGLRGETERFRELNRAVAAAERGVPWWRRELIQRRVVRELGYWDVIPGG